MVFSFIHPHACGFARVAAWKTARQVDGEVKRQKDETSTTHRARQNDEKFQRFSEIFKGNEKFSVDQKHYSRMLGNLRLKFGNWNSRLKEQRNHYFQVFSVENWTKLTTKEQSLHKLQGCRACMLWFSHVQSMFPVKSKRFISLTKATQGQALLLVAEDVIAKHLTGLDPSVKYTEEQAVQKAADIYNDTNPYFEKTYNISFAEALTTIPKLKLEMKKPKSTAQRGKQGY